jgi:hypothetical protein
MDFIRFKGIGSILFLKNSLKKFCRKNYKNHLKRNDFEIHVHVFTAVARCFPNILDVMVFENINLSEDRIGRPPFWYNETELDFCHQSVIYVVRSV